MLITYFSAKHIFFRYLGNEFISRFIIHFTIAESPDEITFFRWLESDYLMYDLEYDSVSFIVILYKNNIKYFLDKNNFPLVIST